MFARFVLVAAALLLMTAPRPASACSKRHETAFELFDAAARVAEVKVVQTPPRRQAGMAQLRVLRTLKGSPRRTLQGAETNTSCHVGYRVGGRAVVFLGPRGQTLGAYEGYLERPADDPLVVVLRAYAAAADDVEARVGVLVDALADGTAAVRDEAAIYLANRPGLLAWVGITPRERLLAAYAADLRDGPLLVVLARLGLDFPAPPLTRRLGFYADLAALLRQRDALEDLNAEGLAERIERGQNGYDPLRIRAMDRCERLHARALYPVLGYGYGVASHMWPKLAESCRTGAPLR